MASLVRLHVAHPLGPGQTLPLSRDQAHYLFSVMRLGPGDALEVFNGRDGAWTADILQAAKRAGTLACRAQSAPQRDPPDLWLLFAPIRKARTDFIVEKATELGVARILPVQTDHTNAERIRRDRLQAHAVEAAEQCGGTFVPEVAELMPLSAVLDGWPGHRRIAFCDEALAAPVRTPAGPFGAAAAASGPLSGPRGSPWAVLVGPEGGFSAAERDRLHGMAQAHLLGLGPRILRADTAAIAALTLWQQALGDWHA